MSVKIVRSGGRDRFAKIPNALLRDPSLSDRARGLLCRMLSHKDGHGPASAAELATGAAEGRDAISRAQAELERAGYLERQKVRLPDGRVITEVTVYDCPRRPGGGSPQVAPDTDSQEPVRPAETHESAGETGSGFSGPGDDQGKRKPSQVAPDTGSQEPAQPGETDVPAGRTGYGFSGTNQKTREDQEEKTKKISQRAQQLEAEDWLRGEYDGLTDFIVTYTFNIAYDRALRAGRPVQNLKRYLQSWGEGDLAAVLWAAMDIEEADQPPLEPEDEPDVRPLRAVPGGARSSEDTGPTQIPVLHVLPDEQPIPGPAEDEPPVELDERGLPAVQARAELRAVLDRINARQEGHGT